LQLARTRWRCGETTRLWRRVHAVPRAPRGGGQDVIFLLAQPESQRRQVAVGSRLLHGWVEQEPHREHRHHSSRAPGELAPRKDGHPAIRHDDTGGSVDRHEQGPDQQDARKDDQRIDDEGQKGHRDRTNEDEEQRLTRIGTDEADPVRMGDTVIPQELLASLERLDTRFRSHC
jgi:hypothetical protein